jgi:hypothetical protein
MSEVPEIKDPDFTKTSPKRSLCMTENERFGLVFTKTGSINSGKGVYLGNSLVGICTLQYEKLAGWVKKPSEKM